MTHAPHARNGDVIAAQTINSMYRDAWRVNIIASYVSNGMVAKWRNAALIEHRQASAVTRSSSTSATAHRVLTCLPRGWRTHLDKQHAPRMTLLPPTPHAYIAIYTHSRNAAPLCILACYLCASSRCRRIKQRAAARSRSPHQQQSYSRTIDNIGLIIASSRNVTATAYNAPARGCGSMASRSGGHRMAAVSGGQA